MIELSDNRQKVNTTTINYTKRANNSNKRNSAKKEKINMTNTESYLHLSHAEFDTLVGPKCLNLNAKKINPTGKRFVSGLKVGIARELINQLQNPDHEAFKVSMVEGVKARIRTGKTDEEKAVENLETSDATEVVAKLSPKAKAALLKALK